MLLKPKNKEQEKEKKSRFPDVGMWKETIYLDFGVYILEHMAHILISHYLKYCSRDKGDL